MKLSLFPLGRTTADVKAQRLLATGRVHIPDVERVIVDGDSGRWVVTYTDTDGRWECECDAYAYRRDCSHVRAVRLITSPPPADWRAAT